LRFAGPAATQALPSTGSAPIAGGWQRHGILRVTPDLIARRITSEPGALSLSIDEAGRAAATKILFLRWKKACVTWLTYFRWQRSYVVNV
jgi:hypothetical protein